MELLTIHACIHMCSNAEGKRRRLRCQSLDKRSCIFCTKQDGHLHEFRTLDADVNVRLMATELQDTALLTRIEGGDLTAIEAKYYLPCLTTLRNKHRTLLREKQASRSNLQADKIEARAFVELVTHVENSLEDGTFCFKLSLLRQMYENRLCNLGLSKEINKVRFKQQVLAYFPLAQEQNDGKNVILVFEHGMQELLKKSMECHYQENALILMKAARIVRNDIFSSNGFSFNASFPPECQKESVPASLKLLVTLLLRGGDILDQNSDDSQACLSVAQTILFNCKAKKGTCNIKSRHSLDHEPPLPLYIGLNVHTQTRSKKLIMELNHMGISISYELCQMDPHSYP